MLPQMLFSANLINTTLVVNLISTTLSAIVAPHYTWSIPCLSSVPHVHLVRVEGPFRSFHLCHLL